MSMMTGHIGGRRGRRKQIIMDYNEMTVYQLVDLINEIGV